MRSAVLGSSRKSIFDQRSGSNRASKNAILNRNRIDFLEKAFK